MCWLSRLSRMSASVTTPASSAAFAARPTSLRAFDAELVGQALEVLFDGVLRHDEGRASLRTVAGSVNTSPGEWRAADEHVALAA